MLFTYNDWQSWVVATETCPAKLTDLPSALLQKNFANPHSEILLWLLGREYIWGSKNEYEKISLKNVVFSSTGQRWKLKLSGADVRDTELLMNLRKI